MKQNFVIEQRTLGTEYFYQDRIDLRSDIKNYDTLYSTIAISISDNTISTAFIKLSCCASFFIQLIRCQNTGLTISINKSLNILCPRSKYKSIQYLEVILVLPIIYPKSSDVFFSSYRLLEMSASRHT